MRGFGEPLTLVPPQLVLRIEAALLLRHLEAQEHAELAAGLVHVRIPLKVTTDSTDRDRYPHRSVTGEGFLR